MNPEISDADRFRRQAEECCEWSERAFSSVDKESWLRLAADWVKLAQAAHERPIQHLE
jgi:hypothetical protein